MLGAIIGDIAGSYYEVLEINAKKKHPTKKRPYEERIKVLDSKVELFTEKCSYTDDSVLTIAIASSLLNDKDYEKAIRHFGIKEMNMGFDQYGRSRFGKNFVLWLKNEKLGDSFGNGGAMRISPIAFYYDDLEIILNETNLATKPSHNTEEAIEGSKAVSTAIYLARKGYSKKVIKNLIEFYFNYNLDMNLEDLQHNYFFSARTSESIPEAIFCFLESNSFEDAIRKALSIGGDSDTIATIVGSISEAFYGIPKNLKEKALTYLPEQYKIIVNNFYEEVELRRALKDIGIEDDEFIAYMRTRVKKNPSVEFWGYFGDYNEKGILSNIRLVVPKIEDEKTLLVNIHEYTHAYEAYSKLGTSYVEDVEQSEKLAKSNEEKYLLKKKLYEK